MDKNPISFNFIQYLMGSLCLVPFATIYIWLSADPAYWGLDFPVWIPILGTFLLYALSVRLIGVINTLLLITSGFVVIVVLSFLNFSIVVKYFLSFFMNHGLVAFVWLDLLAFIVFTLVSIPLTYVTLSRLLNDRLSIKFKLGLYYFLASILAFTLLSWLLKYTFLGSGFGYDPFGFGIGYGSEKLLPLAFLGFAYIATLLYLMFSRLDIKHKFFNYNNALIVTWSGYWLSVYRYVVDMSSQVEYDYFTRSEVMTVQFILLALAPFVLVVSVLITKNKVKIPKSWIITQIVISALLLIFTFYKYSNV